MSRTLLRAVVVLVFVALAGFAADATTNVAEGRVVAVVDDHDTVLDVLDVDGQPDLLPAVALGLLALVGRLGGAGLIGATRTVAWRSSVLARATLAHRGPPLRP